MWSDLEEEQSPRCPVRCSQPVVGRLIWRRELTRRATLSLRCRPAAETPSAERRTAADTGRLCTLRRTCTFVARAASRRFPGTTRSGSTGISVHKQSNNTVRRLVLCRQRTGQHF